MKILSVDFDFFQNVSLELMKIYPPGIDVPASYSESIWARRYARQEEDVMSIGILEQQFEQMKEMLLRQDSEIPAMIAGSHVKAYGFIHEHVPENGKHLLVNVDMHHDMFNEDPKVDCGNWIGFLTKEYQEMCPLWICNPVSKEMYGIKEKDVEHTKHKLAELIPETLDMIQDERFDLIFLCRSDIWLPPHLDDKFLELAELIQSHFKHVTAERDALRPRKEYLFLTEELRKNDTYLDRKFDIFEPWEMEKEKEYYEEDKYDHNQSRNSDDDDRLPEQRRREDGRDRSGDDSSLYGRRKGDCSERLCD